MKLIKIILFYMGTGIVAIFLFTVLLTIFGYGLKILFSLWEWMGIFTT